MNELNENDWELVNAYHDGELSDVERQAMESRLRFEPALQEALRDVASVSASLGALRPETGPSPSEQVAEAANQNRWPTRWLVGGAVAAAIALAVGLGPQFTSEPSVFDVHTELAGQPFAIDVGGMTPAAAASSKDIPDLAGANLTPVAMRTLEDGNVTHYAGHNGCRLTYYRGLLDLDGEDSMKDAQLATWATADNINHMIIANGMDQAKFDAIADFLRLVTKQQVSEQMMASLEETIANAGRCVG